MRGTGLVTRVLICANGTIDLGQLRDACAPGLTIEALNGGTDPKTVALVAAEHDADVVIIDTSLPDFDARSAFQQILQHKSVIRIIALSDSTLPKDIVKIIAAGAQACLSRYPRIGELKDAVETVINNRIYISQRLTDNESPGRDDSHSASRPTEPEMLTAREREILKLLADGHTSRQIGDKLGISEKTVESHRGNIKAKLRLGSIAELTKYAIKHQITSLGA
jgi:DNA-binding NarL/FixJ family response regulator